MRLKVMNTLDNIFSIVIEEVVKKCNLDKPNSDKMCVLVSSDHFKKPPSMWLVTVSEQTPSLILSKCDRVNNRLEEENDGELYHALEEIENLPSNTRGF